MDTTSRAPTSTVSDEALTSAVSWAAIAAGAVAAAALTLVLLSFGAGMGFSAVSPWAGSGVSATTFKVGTGLYLIVVAMIASSIGGYLAGRLRTKWVGVHTDEVYFRDTAHGFLAWAFATIIRAAVLASAATHIAGGAAQGLGLAAGTAASQTGNGGPADIFVDKLLRPDPAAAQNLVTPAAATNGNDQAVQGEMARLWTAALRSGGELAPADRAYVARIVAMRTGMSEADAEKRVSDVTAEAKAAMDSARKAAAQLSLWLTASLIIGAFAASLAATEGGQLRDGIWSYNKLSPRRT
jgi:hypothetical protein